MINSIYLSAQVLKTGVILADLPGMLISKTTLEVSAYQSVGYRDVNFARVKAAQRYLFNCDEVFVVANINRVVSDQSVRSIVSEYLGKGNSETKGRLAIICTHSEVGLEEFSTPSTLTMVQNIDLPEAEKTYSGPRKRIPPETVKAARQQMKLTRRLGVDEHEKATAR